MQNSKFNYNALNKRISVALILMAAVTSAHCHIFAKDINTKDYNAKDYTTKDYTIKVYTDEADRFLEAIPDGLQAMQDSAIITAIEGDFALLEKVRHSRNTAPKPRAGVKSEMLGKNLRLYRPECKGDSVLPLLIYFHGGGWCFGSINSCADFCQSVSDKAGIAVLAVDYPLAPEHPFPEPLDFCCDVLSLALENAGILGVDPERISLGGDSAGGNLAVATALQASEGAVHSLLLFYPVVKAYNDGSLSWEYYKEGYGLDGKIMETFNNAYTGKTNPRIPLISPGTASREMLKALPRTLMINADRDILRDQGGEFAERLRESGVEVERHVFPGSVHLFITVPGQRGAFSDALTIAADFLTR